MSTRFNMDNEDQVLSDEVLKEEEDSEETSFDLDDGDSDDAYYKKDEEDAASGEDAYFAVLRDMDPNGDRASELAF